MSEIVIAPTEDKTPSFADLRKMFERDASEESEASTESAVAPAAEKSGDGKPETTAPESATETTQEPEKPESKPAESAIDRRFSKLAKQRDDARAEADRLRRELEEARKPQPGPADAAQGAEAVATAKKLEKPVPPDPSKWAGTWDELQKAQQDYYEQLADWKVASAMQERDEREAKTRAEAQAKELHGSWEKRAQQVAAKDPEFTDAVNEVGPFVTAAGVADLIMQSDVGPEIVMHLYRNPEEGMRLARLGSPVAIARELGKLEAQLSKPAPQTKTAPASEKTPKPPASVGGGGAPAEVNLDTCDMRTFKREVGKML